MNVELRIADLERHVSDVSLRRARVRLGMSASTKKAKTTAGWDRLERGFRTALHSLRQQRNDAEARSMGES
jgi:hypothetical protein